MFDEFDRLIIITLLIDFPSPVLTHDYADLSEVVCLQNITQCFDCYCFLNDINGDEDKLLGFSERCKVMRYICLGKFVCL